MGPFEAADVAFIETLKARHETLKVQLAAVERGAGRPACRKDHRRTAGDSGQSICRILSNSRPTRGVHGSALTALVAAARRIGAAQLL
jgi:hypothetical protein